MNRRTLIASAISAIAVAPMAGRVFAQSTPDARWDETSYLYGTAFDVLPKARDGEIELLSLTISPDGPMLGFTSLNGLVHNATNDEYVIEQVEAGDASFLATAGSTQNIIRPGAYALVSISVMAELEADADVPELSPVFKKVKDINEGRSYLSDRVPLTLSDVSIDNEAISVTITNGSDTDLDEGFLSGMIMFFDAEGAPINGIALGELVALPAGEHHEAQNYLLAKYDPASLYLVGYYGIL